MRQFNGGELIRSMSLAKRLAEGLSKANTQEDDFELAAELIIEAYHRAPKKLPERLQEVLDEQMHRERKKTCKAEDEKKPPTPEGERLERLLNTNFKPGSVYVKLEVQQDTVKETCIAKVPKEQAEAMMEQLMAEPEDLSEG